MRTFVESRIFAARVREFMDDAGLREVQNELMANPQKGAVIPGCAGLRKVRVADRSRGKGKRGGARVIYLDIPQAGRMDLIAIYGKDEQEDLTADRKRVLIRLAELAKAEATAKLGRKGRR